MPYTTTTFNSTKLSTYDIHFLLHELLSFTRYLCIQCIYLNFDLIPTLNYITEHLSLLYILLLLTSSFEIDLQLSIAICLLFSYMALETVLLLNSAHPDGGFLMDLGDGLLLSKVGSALVGCSIFTNSSPQLEELHQHLS